MIPRTFFWRSFVYFFLLIVLSSALFGIFLYRTIHQNNLRSLQENLRKQTVALADVIGKGNEILANPKILTSAVHTEDRITVMALDGVVLADNWAERIGKEAIENHSDRPEFQAALKDAPVFVSRHSETVDTEMLYYAVPVKKDGQTILVLRLSFPLTDVHEQSRLLRNFILSAAFLAILLSIPFIFALSRNITNPINTIRHNARQIASGDLTQRVPLIGPSEVQELAKEFNGMADQLKQKISSIEEEHARLQTLLSRMVEGVLAIDKSGRAVFANTAFCNMTGTTLERMKGRGFLEITRNDDLSNYISQLLDETGPDTKQIKFLRSGIDQIFSVQASRIYDNTGSLSLILLVFHDVTQTQRVEQMRKDFVANVSHELRTPLTAIQGSTEVLLDGALRDPIESRRFLEIMDKQLRHIHNLVTDMLKLAAVEEGRWPSRRENTNIDSLIQELIAVIQPLANKKNQILDVSVPADIPAVQVDPFQIYDALMNLLDNAVKYTQKNGRIELKAFVEGSNLVISVADNGSGISKEQLPRIFERFYRVDKSRSREIGGTGLGLSIAKHGIENHGGSISVESELGKGTKFIIRLPMA
jgi:two-component system, OmpR family, phosphate regulon sensor histidine kinase PhoR